MTDDLIKELRSYPAHYVAAHRASDVLERIDFYNCRLEDDLVKLEAAAESLREYSSKQALDIVALGQEVGRLREALQNIVYADGDYNFLQAKARAALGEEKK